MNLNFNLYIMDFYLTFTSNQLLAYSLFILFFNNDNNNNKQTRDPWRSTPGVQQQLNHIFFDYLFLALKVVKKALPL